VTRAFQRPHFTASNRLLWPVLAAVRRSGADVSAVLAAVGLAEEIAYAHDSRVGLDQLFDVWRSGVELTGDATLGARLAAFAEPTATVSWPMPLSFFEHLGRASATLRDAVELQNRYVRLMRDGISSSVELEGERAVLRLELLPEQPPAEVEFDVGIAINIARRVTKSELRVDEVWFTHAAPPSAQPYDQLFKARIRFGASFNAVIGRTADFTRPLRSANSGMRARLIRHAESLLADLPSIDVFEDKVCAQIVAELPAGNTNASAVAEKLGVSSRTLHRRLQQEGTSYQELLDRVRLRLALGYLETGKSIADVALLVGFAQASTFHRAFKSWTGETPADHPLRKRPRSLRPGVQG
jgi:AraC-like DNA-binding protein